MAKQGQSFTPDEIRRIVNLLATTDMTILEIAARMDCSRSAVASVNRRYQVREYAGLRSKWTCNVEKVSMS